MANFFVNRLLPGLFLILLIGCSSEQDKPQPEPDSKYDGWKTFTYQKIKILYLPGHPLEDSFEDISRTYITLIDRSCRFLHIPVPADTLRIIFYTGWGQGREMTGCEYPFATRDEIHFWLPSFYGPTLMQYLIYQWQPDEPKNIFLKHGLITLLDFSGQNYHMNTIRYVHNKQFIPLEKLAVDSAIDSNTERLQSAMSASFVDFVVYTYGFDVFESLYLSQRSFEKEVRALFDMSVDSLQDRWLEVADEAAKLDTANYRRLILKEEG
ncbi:MAG: hypothetical protein DRP47_12450 [Candidatus Zixiibacteriota bacterium]|nr:MAG: hypothetical protein DRP47_12450 [candidate division Zixibacteria bacterium]